jgi:hypothetical protein
MHYCYVYMHDNSDAAVLYSKVWLSAAGYDKFQFVMARNITAGFNFKIKLYCHNYYEGIYGNVFEVT